MYCPNCEDELEVTWDDIGGRIECKCGCSFDVHVDENYEGDYFFYFENVRWPQDETV